MLSSKEYKSRHSWIRTTRVRGQGYGCVVNLKWKDISIIFDNYNNQCGYCGAEAKKINIAFPLSRRAPVVPANFVPCCVRCHDNKRGIDLISFYHSNLITKERLQSVLVNMVNQKGGDVLLEYLNGILRMNNG